MAKFSRDLNVKDVSTDRVANLPKREMLTDFLDKKYFVGDTFVNKEGEPFKKIIILSYEKTSFSGGEFVPASIRVNIEAPSTKEDLAIFNVIRERLCRSSPFKFHNPPTKTTHKREHLTVAQFAALIEGLKHEQSTEK